MYFDAKVDVPVVPGKIMISKNVYVKYETGRRCDPEKRYNIPKRVTIGDQAAKNGGHGSMRELYEKLMSFKREQRKLA